MSTFSDVADYNFSHFRQAFDLLIGMGLEMYHLLQTRDYKGVNYPPLFELLVEMLYDHVRSCVQRHVDGTSLYNMGE